MSIFKEARKRKIIELVLYVISLFALGGGLIAYYYESRESGLLPVITYPYRDYALPLLIIAGFCIIGGIVIRLYPKCSQTNGR